MKTPDKPVVLFICRYNSCRSQMAESCPLFPGKAKVIHHGFDDPPKLAESAITEEEARTHYRRVRDEIRAFIETLPQSIVPVSAGLLPSAGDIRGGKTD